MSGVIRGHGIVCQKFSLVTKTAWTPIREPAREQHKLPIPARFTYSYLHASLFSVFKHDPAFKPFCPSTAGMEELSLEQIKTASELEEDIDFERGWWSGSEQYFESVWERKRNRDSLFLALDLFTVPPGLKAGMDFSDKGRI